MKGYKIGINEDSLECMLIELDIPEEYPGAIVYEYITNRILYRSNIARVLSIRKIKDGIVEHVKSAFSLYDQTFYYHPGEIIFPKAFDLDCTSVCSDGIHFFETKADAITYAKDPWPRQRRISAILARNNARYKAYLEADAK